MNRRPIPPLEFLESMEVSLQPAPEVWDWLQAEILSDTGSIHNPDHAHLMDANIGVLRASAGKGIKWRLIPSCLLPHRSNGRNGAELPLLSHARE